MNTNTIAYLESNLVGFVEQAKESGRHVVDFVMEQSPLLVKEILWYNGAISGLYLFFGILVFLFFLMFEIKLYKSAVKSREKYDHGKFYHTWGENEGFVYAMTGTLSGVLLLAISSGLFFSNIGTFIKVVVAPRLYLLEYFSSLVK